jgi:NAD(P)-dependent dehydrogenase (short-subunit alcohol dehydrogenase family)
MQLKSKRIITGCASGIAAETVRAFAREGANVVSVDVNEIHGTPVAVEATRVSARATSRVVSPLWHQSRRRVATVFEEETSRLGGLDALANIAGMEQQVPAGEIGGGDLDLMVAVHVKGTVFTNQAAFRAMRERGGSGLGGEHRRGAVEKPQRRQGPNIGRHRSRKPPQPAPRVRHLGVDTAPSHSTCVRATPTSVAAPQPLRIEPKWARGDFASRFRSCPGRTEPPGATVTRSAARTEGEAIAPPEGRLLAS